MFGRQIVLLTIVACTSAMPAAAQAPAPTTTAFDGTYAGGSFETSSYMEGISAARWCGPTSGVPGSLTITSGVIKPTVGTVGPEWEGTVNPQGGLVMRSPRSSRVDGQIDSQGTIRGQSSGWGCVVRYIWQKAPPPTMPFDGDYVGVSRESTGWSPQCPSNGVPSTLIIRNSAVLGDFFQGSVSQQGNLVIQTPRGTQIRGQIDNQGVIRVQGGNSACTVILVWRKQSG